jgi:hypothetical protein
MKRIIATLAVVGMLGLGQAARADGSAVYVIGPGETLSIPATIYAGSWTSVGVIGDGGTDLDLYVYDPLGRLMGYDDDETDDCLVQFTAPMTGTYTIKVVNRSTTRSNVFLLMIR